jgi:hypothetical protein
MSVQAATVHGKGRSSHYAWTTSPRRQVGTLVQFEVSPGHEVLVETDGIDEGWVPVDRGDDGIVRAAGRFTDHLDCIREAAAEALVTFQKQLNPDEIKLSFGIKITAEAGAVIARTALEGNLGLELVWRRSSVPEMPSDIDQDGLWTQAPAQPPRT